MCVVYGKFIFCKMIEMLLKGMESIIYESYWLFGKMLWILKKCWYIGVLISIMNVMF